MSFRFLTLILFLPAAAFSDSSNPADPLPCSPETDCRLDYDHLSNQGIDPFMFLGKIVDTEHPQWKTYKGDIQRYYGVEDCLIAEERSSKNPNLLLIDWKNVGAGTGAQICIFRIARSLGDIGKIRSWLDYQKFAVGNLVEYRGNKYKPRYETQPIYRITASWDVDQYRSRIPSLVYSLTGYELARRFTVTIGLDANREVSGVGTSAPTK